MCISSSERPILSEIRQEPVEDRVSAANDDTEGAYQEYIWRLLGNNTVHLHLQFSLSSP